MVNRRLSCLLFIIFSAYLGHSLVPHHHHSDLLYAPFATTCPLEQGGTHGEDGDQDANEHPAHCHAFNDAIFEKFTTSATQQSGGQGVVLVICGMALSPEVPLVVAAGPVARLQPPFRLHPQTGTRALRGPPCIS